VILSWKWGLAGWCIWSCLEQFTGQCPIIFLVGVAFVSIA
jgi:hypothetical protein